MWTNLLFDGWRKVNSATDIGNWTSDSEIFDDENCGKPRDYIITNNGPNVTFRNDNIVWDFKNLSIREINLQAVG
jgi:hypothetical protein